MLRLIVQIHDTRLAQAPSFIGSSHCGCMFTVLALTSATAPAQGEILICRPEIRNFIGEGWKWTVRAAERSAFAYIAS